jgi:putative tryptophan/tyrosine transport system substrate-binding protein
LGTIFRFVICSRTSFGKRCASPPIEQPTKVEFVVNLKIAKALGVTIPEAVLLRASEVIE